MGQFSVDPWRPVGLTGRGMDRRDPLREQRIFQGAAAWTSVAPSIEARPRDPEGLAHGFDGKGLVRGHELEDLNDVPSF